MKLSGNMHTGLNHPQIIHNLFVICNIYTKIEVKYQFMRIFINMIIISIMYTTLMSL